MRPASSPFSLSMRIAISPCGHVGRRGYRVGHWAALLSVLAAVACADAAATPLEDCAKAAETMKGEKSPKRAPRRPVDK